MLGWRKQQQPRVAVRLCIEESLDKLPPVYTPAIYQTKCGAVLGGGAWTDDIAATHTLTAQRLKASGVSGPIGP